MKLQWFFVKRQFILIQLACLFFFSSAFASVESIPTVFLTYNKSKSSTASSNPWEGQIKKGALLSLGESAKSLQSMKLKFIDIGEGVEKLTVGLERLKEQQAKYIIGFGYSYQALLAAKMLNRASLIISPSATSDEIIEKYSNTFLFSNSNSIQAQLLTSEIANRKSIESSLGKVLIVEILGCPYCKDFTQRIISGFEKKGVKFKVIKVHKSLFTSKKEIHFENYKATDIVIPSHESDAAKLISKFVKVYPQVRFWGGDGWGTKGRYILAIQKRHFSEIYWLSHYHHSINTPENSKFTQHYKNRYEEFPIDTSAFHFEVVNSFNQILSSFKNKKRIEFNGLTGKSTLLPRQIVRPMPLLSIANGKVKMVKLLEPKIGK